MTATRCWNCGQAARQIHFCEHCGSLQPPAGDYFEYLGLPRKLQTDQVQLEKNFYSLSRRLHPDVHFGRSERERLLAEEATARLNDAYRTLKIPVTRAEYLLSFYGIQKTEQKAPNAPPELLEEVFELKIELEQFRAGDHAAHSRLVAARARFQDLLQEADRALAAGFAEWDSSESPGALEEIAAILGRRNYIRNLLQEVEAALV